MPISTGCSEDSSNVLWIYSMECLVSKLINAEGTSILSVTLCDGYDVGMRYHSPHRDDKKIQTKKKF